MRQSRAKFILSSGKELLYILSINTSTRLIKKFILVLPVKFQRKDGVITA